MPEQTGAAVAFAVAILCSCAVAGCEGCSRSKGTSTRPGEYLSVRMLLEEPAEFHGRRVRVMGCAEMVFEGKGLYVSCRDKQSALSRNAVWLDAPLDASTMALSGQFVCLEGLFDMHGKGHMGLYSGTVHDIIGMTACTEP
jgi:hypothetical protein